MTNKWIDPDPIKDTLEKAKYYIAVREAYHKVMIFDPIIHTSKLERIDDKDWELFSAYQTGEVDGKTYFWGMFVEGAGWFNVCVPAESARALTEIEIAIFSNMTVGMYGSHTDKFSYAYSLGKVSTLPTV